MDHLEEQRIGVFQALGNAVVNGYDRVITDEPECVATDLQSFSSCCEDIEWSVLVGLVREWQGE